LYLLSVCVFWRREADDLAAQDHKPASLDSHRQNHMAGGIFVFRPMFFLAGHAWGEKIHAKTKSKYSDMESYI
jgi:hypothetical protein